MTKFINFLIDLFYGFVEMALKWAKHCNRIGLLPGVPGTSIAYTLDSDELSVSPKFEQELINISLH